MIEFTSRFEKHTRIIQTFLDSSNQSETQDIILYSSEIPRLEKFFEGQIIIKKGDAYKKKLYNCVVYKVG